MEYKLVVSGGTFDRFHKGHEAFLRFIFSKSNRVVLGITSDLYIKKNKKDWQAIESFSVRKRAVEHFLQEYTFLHRTEIVSIDTLYGPTLDSHYAFEAIVVSEDTLQGATVVNNERSTYGLPALHIIVMPLLRKDKTVISSSLIRKGTIDRDGSDFINTEQIHTTILLPEELREEFKKPLGAVVSDDANNFKELSSERTVTVGDMVTLKANQMGIRQKLSVIDFLVERKQTYTDIRQLGFVGNEKTILVTNPPGHITAELLQQLFLEVNNKSDKKQIIIRIIGEEDLAVLPLILICPLGFTILYGQPQSGIVKVAVTEALKQKARLFFNQFKEANTRGY